MAVDIHKRVYSKDALSKKEGSEVTVGGWAEEVRDLGNLVFVVLRDKTGKIQLTAKKGMAGFEDLKVLPRESVLMAVGSLAKGKQKSGAKELLIEEFEILNKAQVPLPIEFMGKGVETDLSKRLDYRCIDLRNPKVEAIFKVRSKVEVLATEFFVKNGFLRIDSPKTMGVASESGANVFSFPYFNKTGFLAQSPQFYKQMVLAAGFDKVWELAPVFRAEKHHTSRHVCEYTSLDFEIAFVKDYEDVIGVTEDLLIYVLKGVKSECKEELELLGVKVEVPKKPFPRVTMAEAIKLFKAKEDDLNDAEEAKLGEYVKKKFNHDFVFLTEFPWSVRPFYHMKLGKDKTYSFDLLFKGLEITTGAQREHRLDVLAKQAKEKGIHEVTDDYLNAFKYGMPPHGGAGIGIGRIVKQALGLENIKEAILFPRDPERITP